MTLHLILSKTSLAAVMTAILALPCIHPVFAAPIDSVEESNKAVVKLYKKSQWNQDSTGSAQELLSPNVNLTRAEFQNLLINASDPGLENAVQPLSEVFPDRVDLIEEIVAEDDMVGIQYRITATHQGSLYGIPATGKSVDIEAVAFYKLKDKKIVEAWAMADEAALLRQIGEWLPERSDGKSIAPAIIGSDPGWQ